MARGIQSIVLGFRLVQVVADAGVPLSLKAIAALSGMSPSKARMYLISFIETGMITQNAESGLYGLGPYALRLGARAMQRLELIAVATEAMHALQRRTDAVVLLGAWNSQGVTVVSRTQGQAPPPLPFQIGGAVSLANTAAGHIFLAFGPQEPIWKQLQAELVAAGVSRTALKKQLKALEAVAADVRERRIAETNPIAYASGITVSGFASIAAPVFDGMQRLRYSMTLIYPTEKDSRRRKEFARLTLEAADRASHLAGADV